MGGVPQEDTGGVGKPSAELPPSLLQAGLVGAGVTEDRSLHASPLLSVSLLLSSSLTMMIASPGGLR